MMVEYAKHVRKPAKLGGLEACPLEEKILINALKLNFRQ